MNSSEVVGNLIRVNSWNSWPLKAATNSTDFTKTITAIWMSWARNTISSQSLGPRRLTPTFNCTLSEQRGFYTGSLLERILSGFPGRARFQRAHGFGINRARKMRAPGIRPRRPFLFRHCAGADGAGRGLHSGTPRIAGGSNAGPEVRINCTKGKSSPGFTAKPQRARRFREEKSLPASKGFSG